MAEVLSPKILEQLSEPFPPDVIEWKPGATNSQKTKALALAYVEVRHYIERLNEIVGPDWCDDYEFIGEKGGLVACRLTVCGVTRTDIGEKGESDVNTATSAVAQSFKRACVKFGLGTHLYRMPRVWVEYDSQYKRFTAGALTSLRRLASEENVASHPAHGDNGDERQPAQPKSKRAKLIARLAELVAESGTLGQPRNLDQTWLDSATEAELTAYGKRLAEEIKQLREQQPDSPIPTNGVALLAYLNGRKNGHYKFKNVNHLRGAIRQHWGQDWDWPSPDDIEQWKGVLAVALEHEKAKLAEAS